MIRGLGDPPVWATSDDRLCRRWRELEVELGLSASARPAAEVWLAAWSALLAVRETNELDGAEQVDSSKLLAQLRQATVALQAYRLPAIEVDEDQGQLRIVR